MAGAPQPDTPSDVVQIDSGLTTMDLRIELLGGFRVSAGGCVLPMTAWRSRNASQLVKRLALAPDHAMLREQLADLLWPTANASNASNSLRQTLHLARRQLHALPLDTDAILLSRGNRVQLYPPERTWTDVRAFEEIARRARQGTDPVVCWQAIEHYPGPLLPDDLYEDWTTSYRDTLASIYRNLLQTVAELHEARSELAASIAALQRLIAVEPAHETAHRQLMRIFATSGNRPLALAQYEQLVFALARAFDIAPEPETQALHRSIKLSRGPSISVSGGELASPGAKQSRSPGNLPHPVSTFIGRERDVTSVVRLIRAHRLVTLTGPGGIGKTRLALEVARKSERDFPDGAWMVRLAGLSDPGLVPQAVLDGLLVDVETRGPSTEALVETLRESQVLLLLDNCEHLIDSCADLVGKLLHACPNVHILATSRETLRLPGERAWAVPPLPLPPPSADIREAAGNDSVRLFMDRAGSRRPGLEMTQKNAGAILTICRGLDGMPLALELAAARVSVLSLAQLASRLEHALETLTVGPRRAADRQQTLRATLDWSFRLLDGNEQILFRRLAVFVGGWTLNMAESICGDQAVPPHAILGIQDKLVSKSLVQVSFDSEETRFRMLEPVRQYAMDKLETSGEVESLLARRAEHVVRFLEEIEPDLSGPRQAHWFARIEREHDNMRAVLRSAIQHGSPEIALRVEAVLWRYWGIRWHSAEGLTWIDETLALPEVKRTSAHARAALGAGELARRILDYDRAIALLEKSLDIHRELGDTSGIAWSLAYLSNALGMAGDSDGSRGCAEESLALFRVIGDRLGMARTLNMLAEHARLHGNYDAAARHYREALDFDRLLGDQQGIAIRLHNLGYVALHEGDVSSAVRSFSDGFKLDQLLGYRTGPLSFLEGMAAAMSAANRPRLSARLYGAWEANCALPGTEFKLHPPDQMEFDRYTTRAEAALGTETFLREWDAGRNMSLEQAVEEALAIALKFATSESEDVIGSRPNEQVS